MKIPLRPFLRTLLQPAFFGALPLLLFVIYWAYLPGWFLAVWLLWLAASFAVWFVTRATAALAPGRKTWQALVLENLLRVAAFLALSFGLGLIGSLAWWAPGGGILLEQIYLSFGSCCSGTRALENSADLFGPMAASVLVYWLHRRQARRALARLAILTALVVGWLVWDEPLANEPSFVAKGTEANGRLDPTLDGRNVRRLPRGKLPMPFDPLHDPGKWRPYVVSQADAIRAEWIAATDSRDWVIGLAGLRGFNKGQIADGSMLWMVTYLHCAYASLLAVEGNGDEAIAVLQPMLAVARQLFLASRTYYDPPFAFVLQEWCQSALRFILDTTPIGNGALQTLSPTLAPLSNSAALCCQVRLADFRASQELNRMIFDRRLEIPHATANLVTRSFERLLRATREGNRAELEANRADIAGELEQPRFKNALGRSQTALLAVHSIADLIQRCWTLEAGYRALLGKVRQRIAATAAEGNQGIRKSETKSPKPGS